MKNPKTHEEILKQLQEDCRWSITPVFSLIPYHTSKLPGNPRYAWREENGVAVVTFQFLPEEEARLQEAGIPFQRYEFRLAPETLEEGISGYRRNRLRHAFIWKTIKEIKAATAEIVTAVEFLTRRKNTRTHAGRNPAPSLGTDSGA